MVENKIKKECRICSKPFSPKTIKSIYCSKTCSSVAYRNKKIELKKTEQRKAVASKITGNREYISVPEAIILFNIPKSTLYRHIRQGRIPAINLGTRLLRIDRGTIEKIFPNIEESYPLKKSPKAKSYCLEPEDCYTIGEISQKFGISDSSVYKHIRKFSIPIRQIGKYVYAPKYEIDNIYNGK